jgi:signal peptidase I
MAWGKTHARLRFAQMSPNGPTSPDDPEWVDEIVRRALERAGADDVSAAPPAATPTLNAPPAAAASQPTTQQPNPAIAPPVDPAPVAAPIARATPPSATQPAARPGALDDLFAPQAETPASRLPQADDLVSAYPITSQESAHRVARAPVEPNDVYDDPFGAESDPDRDRRLDEALGFEGDREADFEGDAISNRIRGFLEWGAVVVGALAVALIIKTFLMQAYFIPSSSMEPTLQVGDRVLVNKLSYDFGDVGRGDLVVFHRPLTQPEGEDDLIKRVVALPGEVLVIRGGEVFITVVGSDEEQLLREPYLEDGVRTTGFINTENCIKPSPASCEIPDGHIFVMGDNRPGSRDSRFFGPVAEDLVVGRAFLRVWPIGDVGFL